MHDHGHHELNRAYDELQREVPSRLSRALRWLREPRARRIRIPLGVLFVLGGFLWFLPILGLHMLPLGLLLLAQDVPFLRRPVGRAVLWLTDRWRAMRRSRRRRRGMPA